MQEQNSGFLNSIPVVTRNLLIINILAWFADYVLSQQGIKLSTYLGLHYITSDLFQPHQILTYMFMHGGFSHLFFNMFAVFMFGRTLETVWGPKKFLTYYILTGVGAALVQMLVYYIQIQMLEAQLPLELVEDVYKNGLNVIQNKQQYTDSAASSLNYLINGVMVGASGAVFGILLAFGMMFPNQKLLMIFFPIPIKAKWFVIGYGVLELVQGFNNNPNDNVAHFAHLGGLFVGLIIMLYWKQKYKKNNGHL